MKLEAVEALLDALDLPPAPAADAYQPAAQITPDDSAPLSRTKLAVKKLNRASRERLIAKAKGADGKYERRVAERLEDEAGELMTSAQPPEICCGEVVPSARDAQADSRSVGIRDTLKDPDQVAIEASKQRTDLLLQAPFDLVAMSVDAADTIGARNSVEKMMAHQMALAHQSAFRFMERAQRMQDTVEQARLANTSARLMQAFQQGLETLHRLRTGGSQKVEVKHVHVNRGGKAVIGNVRTGTRKAGGPKK